MRHVLLLVALVMGPVGVGMINTTGHGLVAGAAAAVVLWWLLARIDEVT